MFIKNITVLGLLGVSCVFGRTFEELECMMDQHMQDFARLSREIFLDGSNKSFADTSASTSVVNDTQAKMVKIMLNAGVPVDPARVTVTHEGKLAHLQACAGDACFKMVLTAAANTLSVDIASKQQKSEEKGNEKEGNYFAYSSSAQSARHVYPIAADLAQMSAEIDGTKITVMIPYVETSASSARNVPVVVKQQSTSAAHSESGSDVHVLNEK